MDTIFQKLIDELGPVPQRPPTGTDALARHIARICERGKILATLRRILGIDGAARMDKVRKIMGTNTDETAAKIRKEIFQTLAHDNHLGDHIDEMIGDSKVVFGYNGAVSEPQILITTNGVVRRVTITIS